MTDLPGLTVNSKQLTADSQSAAVQSSTTSNVGNVPLGQGTSVSSGSVGGKEKEIVQLSEAGVEEIGVLPEVALELKEAGIEQISETVELPQPASEIAGMVHAGPTTPVSTQKPLTVKVPLTDDQIKKALHQKVYDSILWLAYWCLRQIKIAQAKVTGREIS